jgi:hypothetical protein
MPGDAHELIPHHFAFPCVEAGADLYPQHSYGVSSRAGVSHTPCGSVKGRQETVTCRINLAAVETDELASYEASR